jgi:hypothetical protein
VRGATLDSYGCYVYCAKYAGKRTLDWFRMFEG